MSLRISGKQMEIGDAFRGRIEGRVGEAIGKFFDGGYSGHVTVAKSRSGFSADSTIHLDSGTTLQVTGMGHEPTVAFEMAADRLEKRLRRYKRRLKQHPNGSSRPSMDIAYRVVSPVADEDEEVPVDFAPAVVAESTVALTTMSVADAVISLDQQDSPVVVFRNAGSDQINIVYRRQDGNIGWIDPSQKSST
ncbi:MAG: ribosome-associated translation inhibitor RaiA [Rhizobiaceae bacterium]